MRKCSTAALVIAALLGFGAQAGAKANKQACQDWSQLRESVSHLEQMGPNSTVAQYRQAEQMVMQKLQRLSASAQKAAPQETEAVRSSLRQLEKDYEGMPPNATIAEAQNILQRDAAQVRTSAMALKEKLGCKE